LGDWRLLISRTQGIIHNKFHKKLIHIDVAFLGFVWISISGFLIWFICADLHKQEVGAFVFGQPEVGNSFTKKSRSDMLFRLHKSR